MSTEHERDDFHAQGFLRLRGVFSAAQAAAMEECIWTELGRRHGISPHDPGTWKLPLASGLQRLRTHPAFDPIGGPALAAALDDLIGPGRWEVPRHWGQFLVSFPVAGAPTSSRASWHTDFPYSIAADRVVGALVFSFIGDVPEGSGGTLALGGSPALVGRFVEARPELRRARMQVTREALLHSDPWLRSLCCGWTTEDWAARLPRETHVVDGAPLRVVELVGRAGDVVVGHPWLLHSPCPNRGDRPRFMRVQRVRPAAPELR